MLMIWCLFRAKISLCFEIKETKNDFDLKRIPEDFFCEKIAFLTKIVMNHFIGLTCNRKNVKYSIILVRRGDNHDDN